MTVEGLVTGTPSWGASGVAGTGGHRPAPGKEEAVADGKRVYSAGQGRGGWGTKQPSPGGLHLQPGGRGRAGGMWWVL